MLNKLPSKILNNIYSNLSIQDLAKVAQICKKQSLQTSSVYLWTDLLRRDFLCQATNPIDSKNNYQEIKFGLAREREAFMTYIVEMAAHAIEMFKSIGFDDAYIEDVFLKREDAIRVFNALLSGKLFTSFDQFVDEKNVFTSEGEFTNALQFVFEILCKLNASTTINHLLKGRLAKNDEILMQAFKYPNVNIIKAIVEVRPEILNKSQEVMENGEVLNRTPLLNAVLTLLNRINQNASKEIISFLLENGADTQATVFHVGNWNVTIAGFCELALSQEKYVDDSQQDFIEDVLKTIIHHQSESTMKMEM